MLIKLETNLQAVLLLNQVSEFLDHTTKGGIKLVRLSLRRVLRPVFPSGTVRLRIVDILLHIRTDHRKVRGLVLVVVQLLAVIIIIIIITNNNSSSSTTNNNLRDILPADLHILIKGQVLALRKKQNSQLEAAAVVHRIPHLSNIIIISSTNNNNINSKGYSNHPFRRIHYRHRENRSHRMCYPAIKFNSLQVVEVAVVVYFLHLESSNSRSENQLTLLAEPANHLRRPLVKIGLEMAMCQERTAQWDRVSKHK